MSEETTQAPARKRGRPPTPQEDKTNNMFHLVLMKEEMAIFKIAAKLAGLPSTALFIRMAIDHGGDYPALLAENIPKALVPSDIDKTTCHYPLLLSDAGRDVVDKTPAPGQSRSEFIRTAALSKAMGIKPRNPAFDEALHALKVVKGVK